MNLRSASAAEAGRTGRAPGGALLFLLGLAILAACAAPPAWSQAETVLPGSGIRYPGGYDPNTVGEIRGRAVGLEAPEGEPMRFRLETERDTYVVLVCPPWVWRSMEANLPDGTDVRVRGSKTLGRDGVLYVIAQEMETPASGRRLEFRDDWGHPLWQGPRAGAAAPGAAPGGPGRGPGGPRAGPGGGRR